MEIYMKRILFLTLALSLLFSLFGCGKEEEKKEKLPNVEELEWVMSLAQDEKSVVAHHPSQPEEFIKYTDSAELVLLLKAENGFLTLTDETNSEIYEGSYADTGFEENNKKIYDVTVGSTKGKLYLTVNESVSGEESFGLILSVGGYAISFEEKN